LTKGFAWFPRSWASSKRLFRIRGDQDGTFDQPAKVLLGHMMVDSFPGVQAGDGFVFHFKTFQMNNPEELVALLPDLALLQFH